MQLRRSAVLFALSALWRASAQDDVVIRTTTNLVEVRVVAQDAHGKPVANLQSSDFEILDNGKPQPVRLFSAYRGDASPAGGTAAGKSGDASPTPSEYAVILLDWMNATYLNRVFVRDEVLRLLKEFKPRQRLAVFVLSRKNPRLLCDFTSDRDTLIYLVDQLELDFADQTGPAHAPPLGGRRGGRGDSTPAQELALFHARNQLVDTAIAFEKIAEHLAHVPGRKTVLWVSAGIPMTIEGSYYAVFLEPAFGKLNRSDTAIYAIDAVGLDLHPSDSLFEFAHRTGGETFYLSNDLTESMRTALEDMDVSYTLGFHMPEDAKPGLHALRVRVKRPGIRLRYREAYDPAATRR